MFHSKRPLRLAALMMTLAVLMLAALSCGTAATATPVVIEKPVEVIKEVVKEVEVTKEVVREVASTPIVIEKEVEVIKEVVATPVPEKKETIVFSDLNWASAELQNRIAMYIVEHGYGYPVDAVFGDTISLQTGLTNGDTQVSMEIWLPNQQEWWDKVIKEGGVIPVGKSLDDNWQSAFVVPTYVVEENPGLKSVFDLPDYMDLFVTPESNGKAQLVTCIPGWQCEIHNESQVKAYGLEDVVELQNPGSGAGLFASIKGAYEKGEPWLGYMWGPTTISAQLDLTRLEEPPYSDACWAADKRCGYPVAQVLIAVHPSLIARAPDVVEFLRKWDYTAAAQVATEGWMTDNDATSEQAAVWFLKNMEDTWTSWVTEDAAAAVKEALANEG